LLFFFVLRYGALVFVDECHATGFFGKTGRGTEEFFGLVMQGILSEGDEEVQLTSLY
jgi:7-keto-8-aminopelargonate synthetase-like enzyme